MKDDNDESNREFYYRRKCEVDGKEAKAELTAQRNMFPSAQIKMRYVLVLINIYTCQHTCSFQQLQIHSQIRFEKT